MNSTVYQSRERERDYPRITTTLRADCAGSKRGREEERRRREEGRSDHEGE